MNRGSLCKEIQDVNFGTRLSVLLIENVHLIGGPLNRGFTVFVCTLCVPTYGQ